MPITYHNQLSHCTASSLKPACIMIHINVCDKETKYSNSFPLSIAQAITIKMKYKLRWCQNNITEKKRNQEK